VTGASGNTGAATIRALNRLFPMVTVKACGRDRAKTDRVLQGCKYQFVPCDGNDSVSSLSFAFSGCDVLYIIPPGGPAPESARVWVSLQYVLAAKMAGVKHVCLLSGAYADYSLMFGQQFLTLETALKYSGLTYSILRFPFFYENLNGNVESIQTRSTFSWPAHPTARFCGIAISDIGTVSACVLSNPSTHLNHTYTLCGDPVCPRDIANLYTKYLGRQIKYAQVSEQEALTSMTGQGWPLWQATGVCQLWNSINRGHGVFSTHDFTSITRGLTPMTYEQFIEQTRGAYQSESPTVATGTSKSTTGRVNVVTKKVPPLAPANLGQQHIVS
jgi:uncharacterized protein YbjT (DUF2867 family)